MSLFATPQNIPIAAGGSASVSFQSTNNGFSLEFDPQIAGQVDFELSSGEAVPQIWTINAFSSATQTFFVTVTDSISGDTTTLNISIFQPTPLVPAGFSASALVAMVRLRANEPNEPTDAQIISLANLGLEQVDTELGVIRLAATYPTIPNQTIQALSPDVMDIISCSWSTGPVTAQGSLVYPMFQRPEGSFMDFAEGFPAVGFGPPVAYFLFQDASGSMVMQLYPAAMEGQLNVYYRARPNLWSLTPAQSTNLDSSMQEAVLLWTIGAVLDARGRSAEAQEIWVPRYEKKIEDLVAKAAKRTNPKSGQVRDVVSRGYPASLWSS